ncbi:MAG TPA: hypothetical protein VMT46_07910 [Anaerolineaceae bacterium]|nr:hypothetical protein [Anaerolineaceae bacterium]
MHATSLLPRLSAPLRWILLLLAAYTLFAQPGLPACWLEAQPCASHPHPFGHAEEPHSHDYLLDMVLSGAAPAAPIVFAPLAEILALMGLADIFRYLGEHLAQGGAWKPVSITPPPKN